MPGREISLVTQNYYHIFNRGVAKQTIFTSSADYKQALLDLNYYHYQKPPLKLSRLKRFKKDRYNEIWNKTSSNNNKLVEIISYVFMPNHWHILVRQEMDNGIAIFISKFSNSYTRYFNTKHNRVGPLFQGSFKSVLIDSDEQLLHVSRYIYLNPVVSGLIIKQELPGYPWSSYPMIFNPRQNIIDPSPLLNLFKNPLDYKNFVTDQVDYAERISIIRHKSIDSDF
jgi:putative transposase